MKQLPIIVAQTEVGKNVEVKIWRNKKEIFKDITLGRLETSEDFKVSDVVVTSDCEEIRAISNSNNYNYIERPNDLANDEALMLDVIKHVLKIYHQFDDFILLQPTSPLRKSVHIDEAINLYYENNRRSLISVVKTDNCFLKYYYKDQNNYLVSSSRPEFSNASRQSLPNTYRPNGAIYISSKESINLNNRISDERSIAYEMSEEDSIDIDSLEDFHQ